MVSKQKILFVIMTQDENELEFIKKVSEKIREKGHETMFFLMSEGVKLAEKLTEEESKTSENRKVYLCSRNAQEFGVKELGEKEERKKASENIIFGSQYDLSRMVEEADKVIVFG